LSSVLLSLLKIPLLMTSLLVRVDSPEAIETVAPGDRPALHAWSDATPLDFSAPALTARRLVSHGDVS
jgi:hypothetical protein